MSPGAQKSSHEAADSVAVLVLEDGRVFRGRSWATIGTALGEAVFATGMTGYQETLTDPSYRGQIVVMTAPHIGNTGINDRDNESDRMWVAGFVVRDPAIAPSHYESTHSLEDELRAQQIVGIQAVDTRALTRHLRDRGAMRMGIFSGAAAHKSVESLLVQVRSTASMVGANLTEDVTTTLPYLVPAQGDRRGVIAAIDLGIKSMTPQRLSERGLDVWVIPASVSAEQMLTTGVDGVFFSNGPGDPSSADHVVELLQSALTARRPVFGICFGHQMLGRALGLETYKLNFGHRGINQPVQDLRTGRVAITAHNHGFAVLAPLEGQIDTPFGRAEVSHVCLNDNVVEGLRCLDVPAFSVQFHPEAAAGPHDADPLFDEFFDLIERSR